jgi:opacity protein-like surface antigen
MSRSCIYLLVGCLGLFAVSDAMAQSNLGLKAAGLEVAVVNPEDMDATIGFAALADLGTIIPNLMLEANLGYWSTSEEAYGMEASIRDIAVGARAKYLFNISNSRIRPFAGGGLSVHFVSAEMTIPEQDFMGIIVPGSSASDSSTKLGLDLGGGLYAPMTPRMNFVTELWAGVVNDVNQLAFRVGVMYDL